MQDGDESHHIPVPKYVALDTEVFVRYGFNLESGDLRRVCELAESEFLIIIISSVTVKECLANIQKDIKLGFKSVLTRAKSFPITRGVLEGMAPQLTDDQAKDAMIGSLTSRFLTFVKDYCKVVRPHEKLVDQVFECYFRGLPPFSSERSKDEFPDAFTLCAIDHWATRNKKKVDLVSNDDEWIKYCENKELLNHHEDLPSLLSKTVNPDLAYSLVEQLEYVAELEERTTTALRNSFENWIFYLNDSDGDVFETTIEDIDYRGVKVISLSDDAVVFSMQFSVAFLAHVAVAEAMIAVGKGEKQRYVPVNQSKGFLTDDALIDLRVQCRYRKSSTGGQAPKLLGLVSVQPSVEPVHVGISARGVELRDKL